MTKKAFDKIASGLNDAIAHARGDESVAVVHKVARTAPTITPMSDEAMVEEVWLLKKEGHWYRPNCRGYTYELLAAGVYAEDEARKNCDPTDGVTMHRLQDVYIPLGAGTVQQFLITASESALSSSRAEVETLRAALIENSDMLAQSVSGFVSGSASDEAWNISRDRLVRAARVALASSEAAHD